jgi:hypothetical protein
MARAYSPTEILDKVYNVLKWGAKWIAAFHQPETTGVVFVFGQGTNGKTAFTMELAKELGSLNIGKVFYNSLEEGARKTMQATLLRAGITAGSNVIIGCESLDELDERLSKRKSPKVAIIDSIQFLNVRTPRMVAFINKHKANKLLIFVSQAEGTDPKGNVAKDVWYRADLKIWVEGFVAKSQGRYNPGGTYTIWEERAKKYWGEKDKKTT